jgi:hypothetical protein
MQRLLADEAWRGLRFDEKLMAAQKDIRRGPISIYGLPKHVIWPSDTVAEGSSGPSLVASAKQEKATELYIRRARLLLR